MKNRRDYNVFFNTHTVSGIVISVALFVCFLAGAFALFQKNINKWEANAKNGAVLTIDYEKVLSCLEKEGFTMNGRTFFIQALDDPLPFIMVASRPLRVKRDKKKTKTGSERLGTTKVMPNGPISLKIDPKTYEVIDSGGAEPVEHLGTFLYHLHYFDQIPKVGLYLSGLVALFFLFAIITGVLVHWKKIVSNFFTFRLKASLKNLWTDAHTGLGMIGLPFQFMYAVTGSLFGLVILVLLPSAMVLFDGDRGKLLGYIAPAYKTFEKTGELLEERTDINQLVQDARRELGIEGIMTAAVNITHYNDRNAHLMAEFRTKKEHAFYDDAHITYRLRDGAIVEKKEVEASTYQGSILHTVRKLHFAQYGGYFVKAVYFILSLITCFVILSGVMVWLEARNKKKYEKKKKFNSSVGAIYLGASMGLFPAIAFFFCLTKVLPLGVEDRFGMMSNAFFIFWLGYTLYAFFSKDLHRITKHAFLVTGAMGVVIPFLNGLQSGLWFWKSLQSGYVDSFFIDISWLFMGIAALATALSVRRLVPNKVQKARGSISKETLKKEGAANPAIVVLEKTD